MGRAPCCDKTKVKRGPWSPEEDITLRNYVEKHGTGGSWIALPQKAGLKRCGKSCRLRWLNYLRPNIKHGGFTEEEDTIILTLYHNIGSRWSVIASQLPGRTDNDVKNYWNTKLKKKLLAATATAAATTSSAASNLISTTSSPNIDTAAYNMVPYIYNFPVDMSSYQEILDAQIPLPGLIEAPENAYNLQPMLPSAPSTLSPPFSADKMHANGSAAASWSTSSTNASSEDDAFLVEFGPGLLPYDLMNVLDFHEKFDQYQISHQSFGYSPSI